MADETFGDRAERKREHILGAATDVFLRTGYLGTSMDEVAAHARVSKQTVYKYFADKDSLFREIVVETVNEISDPNNEDVLSIADSEDLETDLEGLARRQLARVMRPRLMQLRRLVIGESSRFPELGHLFYERGAGRTIVALATAFETLAERGLLQFDDAQLAAAQFNWLVMSAPINRAMLLGDDHPFSAAELDRFATAGVRTFLAAYGRR